jgi:hypothetical protein
LRSQSILFFLVFGVDWLLRLLFFFGLDFRWQKLWKSGKNYKKEEKIRFYWIRKVAKTIEIRQN